MLTNLPERVLSPTRLGLSAVVALSRTGLIAPVRPDRLVRIAAAPLRLGGGLATLCAIAAARDPDHPAVVDERGVVTYGQLDRSSGRIAAGLRDDHGLGPGRTLAVMCRNHRGFAEAAIAASRCGADLLPLNTELPAARIGELLERERPAVIVHDDEFSTAFEAPGLRDRRVIAWTESPRRVTTLDALAEAAEARVPASRRQGRLVLLTSGTTGTPKSAPRGASSQGLLGPAATLLIRLPLRAREPMLIAPPLFHGFGFAFLAAGLLFGSTIVLRRKFDAVAALVAIEENRATAVVAVPAMLQRIMQLPAETRGRHNAGSLRTVISAAAPLGGELSSEVMDAFGDVLYNIYGTTEAGLGALATPADLRAAPGTVGRPPYGTTLKILDESRAEVIRGQTGHVFIGGGSVFEGYSDGRGKETVGGLVNTGDLGHLDPQGRLFIDGREDDMIVSGGENVFPQEVEDVLQSHPGVADVAVVGVDDAEFGQRLTAFVVSQPHAAVTAGELKTLVKSSLEGFKAPREIVFLDELPRNPIGKVMRRELVADSARVRAS